MQYNYLNSDERVSKMLQIPCRSENLDDGGQMLIYISDTSERELTIVIPTNVDFIYFTAESPKDNYKLTGAIDNRTGSKNLFSWLTGESEAVQTDGLILPE